LSKTAVIYVKIFGRCMPKIVKIGQCFAKLFKK